MTTRPTPEAIAIPEARALEGLTVSETETLAFFIQHKHECDGFWLALSDAETESLLAKGLIRTRVTSDGTVASALSFDKGWDAATDAWNLNRERERLLRQLGQ